MYLRFGKRWFDASAAALGLIALSPLLLFSAITVRVSMGSPMLFRQARPGRDGVLFTLLKFRTMRDARDQSGELLADGERVTRVGNFLRRSSLDELPELINVLRGDMSLVGPRPLLVAYLPHYSLRQARRHEVCPGITGWAQVNGRNAVSWSDRFELDVWYVEHISLLLDLKILMQTIGAVVLRRGIAAEGHATMPPFRPVD